MAAVPAGDPAEWFSPDNYPAAALRADRQGRVVVELGIDTAGAVATCTVKSSSGTTLLDEGTCAVAREKGRFNPASDAKGRLIVGRYLMPVRGQLPDAPLSRDAATVPHQESVAFEVFVSAQGVLASCQVIEKPVRADNDPCRQVKVGEQGEVMMKEGRPVPYRLIRRYSQEVVIGDGS